MKDMKEVSGWSVVFGSNDPINVIAAERSKRSDKRFRILLADGRKLLLQKKFYICTIHHMADRFFIDKYGTTSPD